MNQLLLDWITENKLLASEVNEKVLLIEDAGHFMIVDPKQGKVVNNEFKFIFDESENDILKDEKINHVLFSFGGRWYYSPVVRKNKKITVEVKFNDFKYLGKVDQELDEDFIHLGVHTEYELMNGTHPSSDWLKKAGFLGHKCLGICDKNTLAGTLPFQLDCISKGIKPIIGQTVSVMYDNKEQFDLKLYVIDKIGWRNLLRINKIINVDRAGEYIEEQELLQFTKGLVCVFDSNSIINRKPTQIGLRYIERYYDYFDELFYQWDSVVFDSVGNDSEHRNNQKRYVHEYLEYLEPILLNDSYYLDKEEARMKLALNKINKRSFPSSKDQYYKNLDDTLERIMPLFNQEKSYGEYESYIDIIQLMVDNTVKLANICEFTIETGKPRLPDYKFDGDNKELFELLIAEGWKIKVESVEGLDKEVYFERLETEMELIIEAGFVDYFLILWDMIFWAKENDILVGTARGSVAGSLVSYLIGITEVDPIKYDLLFERFLNKTRVMPEEVFDVELKDGSKAKVKREKFDELLSNKKVRRFHRHKEMRKDSLPDIDTDFAASKRDDVKRYVEEKYGDEYVCSIGTYTRMALKGGLKDFNRELGGVDFSKMNYITKQIEQQVKYGWEDLFKYVLKSRELREYVQTHKEIVHNVKFSLNQCKSASIHASAIVIVPDKDEEGNPMTLFDWMPVRLVNIRDKDVLVSEWEGEYIDKAGFLKEDILGLILLDKLDVIMKLIKKHYNKSIVLEEIPLDEDGVYKLFKKGWNEDIFQFGSLGLKKYSQLVKPDNLDDLIAMSALYRPGAMGSNAHTDFADIKHGKKEPEYDYGLKEVTKSTHGLFIYQEQIMKAVHVLGGLSLAESDSFRSAIKKFDKDVMDGYENKFLDGALKNGCDRKEAEKIWDKLLSFSAYGFNLSHSTAYSIMSYWGQWFKYHYTLEFYTAALNFAKTDKNSVDVDNILNEIPRVNNMLKKNIKVNPPDINFSTEVFSCDDKSENIFWSLKIVKNIGEVMVQEIVKERNRGGQFDSMEHFILRMKGKRISRRIVDSLVVSGAFDVVENLRGEKSRGNLLKKLYKLYNDPFPQEYEDQKYQSDYNWIILQKEFCFYGQIDMESIIRVKNPMLADLYINPDQLLASKRNVRAAVAGYVQKAVERSYKDRKTGKNKKMLSIWMKDNNDFSSICLWNEEFDKFAGVVLKAKEEERMICISGKVNFDQYNKRNQVFIDKLTKMVIL